MIGNRIGIRIMRTLVTSTFAALVVAFSAPAYVHHSGAMFDAEKMITITGTVTEFSWTNPHASFRVDVPNKEGKLESWAIEMNSPNNLVHEGWKRPASSRATRSACRSTRCAMAGRAVDTSV